MKVCVGFEVFDPQKEKKQLFSILYYAIFIYLERLDQSLL